MGTGGLQTIQQFSPSRDLPVFKPLTHGVARGPFHSGKPPKPDGAPALAGLLRGKGQGGTPGLEKKLADEFEAIVYSSQMERVALSASFFSVTGQAASSEDGEAEAVQAGVQQLSFEFFAESRTEELALFRQRTEAVADGLEGTTQETFIEASQRVAARFSLSLEVSGVVLSGFAGGEGRGRRPDQRD